MALKIENLATRDKSWLRRNGLQVHREDRSAQDYTWCYLHYVGRDLFPTRSTRRLLITSRARATARESTRRGVRQIHAGLYRELKRGSIKFLISKKVACLTGLCRGGKTREGNEKQRSQARARASRRVLPRSSLHPLRRSIPGEKAEMN